MPTKVADIFNHFELTIHGQVKWNTEINSNKCGVYVIALTNDINKLITLEKANFNDNAINNWIELIKTSGKALLVDGELATTDLIKERLSQFWFSDETILYIGKAGPTIKRTLKVRVEEFYKTKLGCDKKHAGGHWLNTLQNLSSLNIFYSETNPDIEEEMIKYFCEHVSDESKSKLFDTTNCFPFANKEKNKSIRKKHGLSNQTINCGSNWKK